MNFSPRRHPRPLDPVLAPWFERLRHLVTPNPAWIGLLASIALTFIGLSAIATAEAGANTRYAAIQAVWVPIALACMLICLIPPPRIISMVSWPIFVFTLLLLVLLLIPYVPRSIVEPRNGARCWINLGFMSFQPGELAKIFFVLAVAHYLRYRENYRTLGGLLVPFAIMFVPVILILKEPDLGMALLFAPALFAMLVAAGARKRHLATLIGIAVVAVALNVAAIYTLPSHPILKPHQVNRIKALIAQTRGETKYTMDIGYQQDKSMTLIGAGGLAGFGADRAATIIRFNRLPEDHNDMIFAVIVNRWGLLGGGGVLGLYSLLLVSYLIVAARSKDPFARLSIVGFVGILFAQITILSLIHI